MEETIEININDNKFIEDTIWMVRPCKIYNDEYKECTSMKGRFHQRYVTGEVSECWQWKQDFNNCTLYEKTKEDKNIVPVINHEIERRNKRIEIMKGNDVWEYRTSPPADWNQPIPANLTTNYDGTEEMGSNTRRCVIS